MANYRFIRQWREFRMLTRPALSAAAGISVAQLTAIETGRRQPKEDVQQLLAAALEMPHPRYLGMDPATMIEIVWDD